VKKGETIMTRKMTIAILVLALCALLLPSALIAKKLVERPWKDKGQFTNTVNLLDGSCVLEGSGHATHVGRYTLQGSAQINFEEGTGSGSGIVTAANGDQLFYHSEAEFAGTFSGGTGRFEGATGDFILVCDPPEITYENENGIPMMIMKYTNVTGTGTITY
jgi:hypothetical protein